MLTKSTNLFNLRKVINDRYGVAHRAAASYMESGDLSIINEASCEVCSDFPIFVSKWGSITTVAAKAAYDLPDDIFLPRILRARWKPGEAANAAASVYGEIDSMSCYEMNTMISNSWRESWNSGKPTILVFSIVDNSFYLWPLPDTSGLVLEYLYPANPVRFTGAEGEDSEDSEIYSSVPDDYIGRLVGLKVAEKLALQDIDNERANQFRGLYDIEKIRVSEEIHPYSPQLSSVHGSIGRTKQINL